MLFSCSYVRTPTHMGGALLRAIVSGVHPEASGHPACSVSAAPPLRSIRYHLTIGLAPGR